MKRHLSNIAWVMTTLFVATSGAIVAIILSVWGDCGMIPVILLSLPALIFALLFSLYVMSDIYPDMIGSRYFRKRAIARVEKLLGGTGAAQQSWQLEQVADSDYNTAWKAFQSLVRELKLPLERFALDGLRTHSFKEYEALALSNLVGVLAEYETGTGCNCRLPQYVAALQTAEDDKTQSELYLLYVRGTSEEKLALALIYLLKSYLKLGGSRPCSLGRKIAEHGDMGDCLRRIIRQIVEGDSASFSAFKVWEWTQVWERYVLAICGIIRLCRRNGYHITLIFSQTLQHGL